MIITIRGLKCHSLESTIPPPMRIRSSSLSTAMSSLCHHVSTAATSAPRRERVVVIMGATGTGKSNLSITLAGRFAGEVVNSDKIQVYAGLDVTTNKLPDDQRRGVPHHVLGTVDPSAGEMGPTAFRHVADAAIRSVSSRGGLPIVAGGSNSFVRALVSDPDRHDTMRYRCCFLWVDVEKPVLMEYLDRRVEEMVGSGMVEELEGYFGNVDAADRARHVGLRKAIGVPEFEGYFRKRWSFAGAVGMIKESTRRLAVEQVAKIRRLEEEEGWALRRLDATSAVRARLDGVGPTEEAWERDVVGPAFATVEEFLKEEGGEEEVEFRDVTPLPLTSCAR